MKLTATFLPQTLNVEVKPNTVLAGFGNPIARDYVERDPYTGDYTITPSSETQVFQTKNKRMTDNITVNPIPSDWGHISWSGSVLTVS